jgi:SAM-dependent methyltransferase
VGCASGAFLAVAAEAGWQVVGVDPSESLCRAASARLSGRGQVVCGTLEEAAPVLSPSDVLTLWDVLEHVADPVAFLETCRELVRPGGIVVANVPDLDSLPARLFRGRWPLMLPEHLSYFNRRSLRVLGERVELDWLAAGRRLASFSVGYVLFRLGQHRMPGAATIARFTSALWIDRLTIPVPLGELFVVWRR